MPGVAEEEVSPRDRRSGHMVSGDFFHEFLQDNMDEEEAIDTPVLG